MCIVIGLIATALAGTIGAGTILLFQAGARTDATPIFPADARDPLMPVDRNGNPRAF